MDESLSDGHQWQRSPTQERSRPTTMNTVTTTTMHTTIPLITNMAATSTTNIITATAIQEQSKYQPCEILDHKYFGLLSSDGSSQISSPRPLGHSRWGGLPSSAPFQPTIKGYLRSGGCYHKFSRQVQDKKLRFCG